MASRDARGRFLPGNEANRDGRPPSETVKTTLVATRVTGYEAEQLHSVARQRGTTLSELIRAFLMRLVRDEGHRLR